jgi:hypothetical protein
VAKGGEQQYEGASRYLQIVAQDPSVLDRDGRILRAIVAVPNEAIQPGPRGPRFHVVDVDPTTGELVAPAFLDARPVDSFSVPDATLIADSRFRAQNVYAIAARTLSLFETALGRRVPWAFPSHHLYLVPRAWEDANAEYQRASRAVRFGFVRPPSASGRAQWVPVYTALSHDIVVHEVTHAILDGLRPGFEAVGFADQDAFHEALADLVALLSVFSLPDVVVHGLEGMFDSTVDVEDLTRERLRTASLFNIAEELGQALAPATGAAGAVGHAADRGRSLRRSVAMEPNALWRRDSAFEDPHARGEVLVAAVLHALIDMWYGRLLRFGARVIDQDRVAEQASLAANHLLSMIIRALDYLPPVEFEFEDFLIAVLISDRDLFVEDAHDYRASIVRSFQAFGIEAFEVDFARRNLQLDLNYQRANAEELRRQPDEVFRFIWDNASALGIDTWYDTAVHDVRAAKRMSEAGFPYTESFATYVQTLDAAALELVDLSHRQGARLVLPAGLDPQTLLRIHGGGVLTFDQFGRAKHHIAKRLFDWERQSRRLHGLMNRPIALGPPAGAEATEDRWLSPRRAMTGTTNSNPKKGRRRGTNQG